MRPDNSKWIALIVVAAIIGAVLGPILGNSLSFGSAMLLFGVVMLGVVGVIVWSLSGNKVGKPASAAQMADARAMAPGAGMARIYVVRRGFMGGLAGMKVGVAPESATGATVAGGQIRMNQFVMAEVPPGAYTVETAMARNGMKPSNAASTLSLHAGEVAVILAQLQMEALHAQTMHQRLPGAEAQRAIGAAKMVQWTQASA